MKNTPEIRLICDLQFGSTGKGLLAGYLAEKHQPDTVVSAWSPNAGHTYIDANGRKYVHTMLPNGVVSPKLKRIMLGPGSIINLESLISEMESCADHLAGTELIIHPHAAIVTQEHRDIEEGTMTKIGSTKKGSGACLIDKIRRDPDRKVVAKQVMSQLDELFQDAVYNIGMTILLPSDNYHWLRHLAKAGVMQIEGAQGYSLGMNSGFYPYTTSRECTPAQICTDCGVPAYWPMTRIGTARTYPIRVSNRYDESGKMVGWSGPGYIDQEELDWSQVGPDGAEVERTTVTKLPRRVFTFSPSQVVEAIRMGGIDEVFLNFVNYSGADNVAQAEELCLEVGIVRNIARIEGAKLRYLGFGPDVSAITEEEGES